MPSLPTSLKKINIPWIGEIPEEWSIVKIKYISALYTGNSIKDADKDKYPKIENTIPYISTKDITIRTNEINYSVNIFTNRNDKLFSIAPRGSILLCIEGGSAGRKISFLDRDVSFVNKLCCIVPEEHPRYLYYYLQSFCFKYEFELNLSGLIGGVSQSYLKNFSVIRPPIKTQATIANYLDQKIEKIATLLSNKKQLINFLKEQKQSIIHQAVTKGINKNSKMKDSGIPWIGDIPEDWKVSKIKQIVSTRITDGPHETPELLLEGIPFASVESVYDGKINFESIRGFISKEQHKIYSQKCKPQRNDIFIVKSGSTTGKIAVLEEDIDFNIWSPLALVRVKEILCDYKFIYYFFTSESFQKQIQTFWSFGTQPNIGMGVIENLHTSLPPLNIQRDIVKHIEQETSQIDSAIKKIEQEIILIEEYRTSLIYQAVTGKINIS